MKKLLFGIFPWKLNFTILQLEGYKYSRYLTWLIKNPLKRTFTEKKSLVVTKKLKILVVLSVIYSLIIALSVYYLFGTLSQSLTALLFLSYFPFIQIGLSILTIKPYEIINKKLVIKQTRDKILALKNKGLVVIAITGSYGKTSTKEILYQFLKVKHKVLATPDSYNTVFGIAKVVDLELDNQYKYFICEMAAYKPREISELSHMIPPDYGMLTGITPQHLERFGSLQNIVKAKFELYNAVKDPQNIILNLKDKNIANELHKRGIENPQGYGIRDSVLKTNNIRFSKTGSSFVLSNKRGVKISTALFGFSNVNNLLSAATMAHKLGITLSLLQERAKILKPFPNRLTVRQAGKSTIVDNTYSSNILSFQETIRTAKSLGGSKVIITPGLVELGSKTKSIHQTLGNNLNGVFDKIILVGKNKRTKSLISGLPKNANVETIEDSRTEYFKKVSSLTNKYDWIFLENDISQNY